MDYLQQRNLIVPATRVSPIGNALVLVTPADRPRPMTLSRGTDLVALLGNGRLATGDPAHVPVAFRAAACGARRGALRHRLRDRAASCRGVAVAGTFPAGSHPPIT
jgi:molybdate transport system substrate-binding protein